VSVPPPEIVPIFATPFGVVVLPDATALNAALLPLFAARATPDWREPAQPALPRAFRSRDDLYEWPDEPVQRLARGMLAGVSAVAASINDFAPEQFAALRVEARAWFTIVQPDGCVPSTSYANSAWLAVYCVAAPEPSASRLDSGVLRLHESRLGTMFPDATTSEARMPYKHGHSAWRPQPGQMAVFPGAITHEIALLRSSGDLVIVTARVRFVGPDQTGVPWW
jgi:hypothetical protein